MTATMRSALGVLGVVGLLVASMRGVAPGSYEPALAFDYQKIYSGEMLLHRITRHAGSDSLPLMSVLAALLFNHCPASWSSNWRRISALIAFVLIVSLARLLGAGRWRSLLAVALLLLVAAFPDGLERRLLWFGAHGDFTQTIFGLLVLIVAGVGAWYSASPGPGRSALLGLALGACLLYRSTLVFFPPLLGAFHWWAARSGRASRGRGACLVSLCLAPYLFLLPWIAVNWKSHQRLIVLEHAEADLNVIGGALGVIKKDSSDPRLRSFDFSAAAAGGGAKIWAARWILRHPALYAKACLARLKYALLLHPLLFLLASYTLLRRRGDLRFQFLGCLTGYLLLIHCLMAVLPAYFEPLWPLLAVLACCAPRVGSIRPAPGFDKPAGEVFSAVAFQGALAAVMACCLFTYCVLASYAGAIAPGLKTSQARQLDAAIAAHPRDAVLRYERGLRRLGAGESAAALADLDLAASLQPRAADFRRGAIWANLSLGNFSDFLRWSSEPRPAQEQADGLLKAFGFLTLGRRSEAERELSRISGGWEDRLRPGEALVLCRSLISRGRLEGDYSRLAQPCGRLFLNEAEFMAASEEPRVAISLLEAADRFGVPAYARTRLARLYWTSGGFDRALAIAAAEDRLAPEEMQRWLDLADAAVRAGRLAPARRLLTYLERQNPRPQEAARIAAILAVISASPTPPAPF